MTAILTTTIDTVVRTAHKELAYELASAEDIIISNGPDRNPDVSFFTIKNRRQLYNAPNVALWILNHNAIDGRTRTIPCTFDCSTFVFAELVSTIEQILDHVKANKLTKPGVIMAHQQLTTARAEGLSLNALCRKLQLRRKTPYDASYLKEITSVLPALDGILDIDDTIKAFGHSSIIMQHTVTLAVEKN